MKNNKEKKSRCLHTLSKPLSRKKTPTPCCKFFALVEWSLRLIRIRRGPDQPNQVHQSAAQEGGTAGCLPRGQLRGEAHHLRRLSVRLRQQLGVKCLFPFRLFPYRLACCLVSPSMFPTRPRRGSPGETVKPLTETDPPPSLTRCLLQTTVPTSSSQLQQVGRHFHVVGSRGGGGGGEGDPVLFFYAQSDTSVTTWWCCFVYSFAKKDCILCSFDVVGDNSDLGSQHVYVHRLLASVPQI